MVIFCLFFFLLQSSSESSSDGEPRCEGANGGSGGSGSNGKKKRQRKRFTPELKKETHMTRITGACLPCWKNKKRVINPLRPSKAYFSRG